MKIIMTKGLPGCGKTTWAKEYQGKNPNTIRVNKDDLRSMLHNGVHSKGREKFVIELRDHIVIESLNSGHDVIVDDTNYNPIHEERLRFIAEVNGNRDALFEIKDFSNVPLDECIKRDAKRDKPIGEKVIRTMYNQYLKPTPPVIEFDPSIPEAIICDIDGTLALFGDANPYDRDFSKDVKNNIVHHTLSLLRNAYGAKVILCSGRQEKNREATVKWLNDGQVSFDELFMRKTNDVRKDTEVKKEIYENQIKGKYNVKVVLDDRNQVVDMWRSLGLTCFQVAPGDF